MAMHLIGAQSEHPDAILAETLEPYLSCDNCCYAASCPTTKLNAVFQSISKKMAKHIVHCASCVFGLRWICAQHSR